MERQEFIFLIQFETGFILFSELKDLIKDLTKECAILHQHHKDIKEQNAEIKQQNIAIKEQYDEMKQLMSDILSHSKAGEENLSDTLFEPLEGFPLQSKEQFDELNSNREQRKALVRLFIITYCAYSIGLQY